MRAAEDKGVCACPHQGRHVGGDLAAGRRSGDGCRGHPRIVEGLQVVESGIVPVVNTGIAHKEPGIGMVGAGLVKPPASCFAEALLAFARSRQGE